MSHKEKLQAVSAWWMENVGRRGSTLLLFGSLTAYRGYEYMLYYPTEQFSANLQYVTAVFPFEFWGFLFLVCGIISVIGGYHKRLETISYSALSGLYGVWSLAFLIAYVADFFTAGQTSYGALGNAVQVGGIAAFIAMCAGWSEIRKEHR